MSPSTTATQAVSRRIHLVGSLPLEVAPDPYAAMRWQLDHADLALLTALPADRDPNWIVSYLRRLNTVPGLQQVLRGEFARYDEPIAYRAVPGQGLDARDLALGRLAEVEEAMAARRRLAQECGRALPPHQVSIPAPLDLAMFVFGVPAAAMGLLPARASLAAFRAALTHLPLFAAAVAEEIQQIHRCWGHEVAFQIESPAVCVAYDRSPRGFRPLVTRYLVRATTRLLAAIPADAALTFHIWCHGDLNNEPIADPGSLVPMVTFVNRLSSTLRAAGRAIAIPPFHAALADGASPPPLDPGFYEPLRELDKDVPLIVGLIDEQHPSRASVALRLVERALARPVVAVSAPCGLGRRSPARAEANMRLAQRLAESEFRSPRITPLDGVAEDV
ncbi:hypothetical protein L2C96_15470 [Amycolatopsis tucumanensis]|nr:hypothetical protein [Amycolatopsis tucumanensis]